MTKKGARVPAPPVGAPRHSVNPNRHHRLKGAYGSREYASQQLEQWQYEVTGAARVWFLIDDDRHRVYLSEVHIGHPKKTE